MADAFDPQLALESWSWQKTIEQGFDVFFDTAKEGWIVTGRSGMRPDLTIETYPYASGVGAAVALPQLGVLAPSVSLRYASSDPVETQEALKKLVRSLPINYWHQSVVRCRPYMYHTIFRLRAISTMPDITYRDGGRIVDVTIKWQAFNYYWDVEDSYLNPVEPLSWQNTSQTHPW